VGIARSYERGGAAGISVLTEPEHFGGRLEYVSLVKEAVALPVMMKDIVVDMPQVKAAYCCGADAVLLIAGVFLGGMGAGSLAEMVRYVHEKSMEAVVEVHNEEEYTIAISGEADMVGINNRDLDSLSVSIDTSIRLLKKHPDSKPVICESGIASRKDIESLRSLGADGFLVGTALMNSSDKEGALREMSRR
jgi:indole-3-glycerol phosphate synthase